MGCSVVTTVLAPAASHDLTDLATAKDELEIAATDTSRDSWLGRAIGQVSRAIAKHVNRVLVAELVADDFDIEQDPYPDQTPGGVAPLALTRWPVLTVLSVAQTLSAGSMRALTEGTDFRVDRVAGQLLRLNPVTGAGTGWEAMPVSVRYAAGHGVLVSESHAVPSSSPWQVTVAQAAGFGCDVAVGGADGTPLARVTGGPGAEQYAVAAGVYTFAAADAGRPLSVVYAARSIPDDLVMVCLRLIADRLASKGRDPMLVEQETPGIGRQRWWLGGAPGQRGPFAPDLAATLEPYRVPVVA